MNSYAWPAAFAFVGMCAAIAFTTVYYPEPKSAQLACIEGRGKWIPGGWRGTSNGTCEFPSTTSK